MVLTAVTAYCLAGGLSSDDNESTTPLDYVAAFPGAPVRLPQLLGDGVVLQRDQKIAIWGWGEYTHTVTVRVADAVATATVGTQNVWATTIGPLKSGGP
jgi:sialate O-acetylesterase